YLEKIISFEYPLTTLPIATRQMLLNAAFQPLVDHTPPESRQYLLERVASLDSFVLAEALPTPRRINRVAQSVMVEWFTRSEQLDIADLVVLTVIQYAFPKLYAAMHERPELFVLNEWITRPGHINTRDVDERRTKLIKSFEGDSDPDDVNHR